MGGERVLTPRPPLHPARPGAEGDAGRADGAGEPPTCHLIPSSARVLRSLFLYVALFLGAIPILIPFLWMLSTSLKTRELTGEYPPRWLPQRERSTLNVNGVRVEVLALVEGM